MSDADWLVPTPGLAAIGSSISSFPNNPIPLLPLLPLYASSSPQRLCTLLSIVEIHNELTNDT